MGCITMNEVVHALVAIFASIGVVATIGAVVHLIGIVAERRGPAKKAS